MKIASTPHENSGSCDVQPRVAVQDASAPRSCVAANGRIVEWFELWYDPLRSWFRNRAAVSSAELDDLTQDVFVRLLRYSDETIVQNPHGYLLRIAKNVASEWRQRSRIRNPHASEWLDDLRLDSEAEPENALLRARAQQRIRDIVNQLPTRQRELLICASNGLTYKQIADQRGLTYRIVLRDLTRAYATLREKLRFEEL